jgi:hypothetical protein
MPVASPRSVHESVLVHGPLSASGATIWIALASLRRRYQPGRFQLSC